MPSKYLRQIDGAYKVIKKKGQLMTLHRIKIAFFDPIKAISGQTEIEATTTGYGIVLPASNGTIEAFDDRILSNPSALQSFRFVILAGKGLTFDPGPNDLLVTTEGPYRLLGATRLDPDGQGSIIFNCGCTLDTHHLLDQPGMTTEGGLIRDDSGRIIVPNL